MPLTSNSIRVYGWVSLYWVVFIIKTDNVWRVDTATRMVTIHAILASSHSYSPFQKVALSKPTIQKHKPPSTKNPTQNQRHPNRRRRRRHNQTDNKAALHVVGKLGVAVRMLIP